MARTLSFVVTIDSKAAVAGVEKLDAALKSVTSSQRALTTATGRYKTRIQSTNKQVQQAANLEARLAAAQAKQAAATDKAAAASKKLGDAQQSTSKRTADLNSRSTRTSSRMKTISGNAGELDSIMISLGGAIGLVDKDMEKLVVQSADVVAGFEGVLRTGSLANVGMSTLAAGVAALAVVVAAGVATWSVWKNSVEEAAEAGGRLGARVEEGAARLTRGEKAIADSAGSWGKLTEAQREAEQQAEILMGSITETEAAVVNQERATRAAGEAQIRTIAQQVAATEDNIAARRALLASGDLVKDEIEAEGAAIDHLNVTLIELTGRLEKRKGALEDTVGVQTLVIRETAKAAEAEKSAADTERARTKTLQDQAAALREKEAAERASAAAAESVQRISERATGTEEGDIIAQRDRQLRQLQDIIDNEKILAETRLQAVTVQGEVEAAATRELIELDAERAEALAQQARQREEEIARERELRLSMAEDTSLAILGATDTILQAKMDSLDTETAAGQEAAVGIFNAQKALGLAEVAISLGVGLARAASQPFPLNIAMGAQVVAGQVAAGVAIAAAKPPAFDIGGLVMAGGGQTGVSTPDQVSASLLPNEAVLNRGAVDMIGEAGVNALNRGPGGSRRVGGGGGQPYEHFNRFIKDETRRGGALPQAMRKSSRRPIVGQRR